MGCSKAHRRHCHPRSCNLRYAGERGAQGRSHGPWCESPSPSQSIAVHRHRRVLAVHGLLRNRPRSRPHARRCDRALAQRQDCAVGWRDSATAYTPALLSTPPRCLGVVQQESGLWERAWRRLTALHCLLGATDPRIGLVISNNSGCGPPRHNRLCCVRLPVASDGVVHGRRCGAVAAGLRGDGRNHHGRLPTLVLRKFQVRAFLVAAN